MSAEAYLTPQVPKLASRLLVAWGRQFENLIRSAASRRSIVVPAHAFPLE